MTMCNERNYKPAKNYQSNLQFLSALQLITCYCLDLKTCKLLSYHLHFQQWKAAFLSEKALIKQLYSTCPAPIRQQTIFS